MTSKPILARTSQRVIQTLLILLTLYYTLVGGFFAGVHEAHWRLVTYILSGLLLGGWLVSRLIRNRPWSRTPLDWPILAVILAVTLATLTSTDARLSFDSLLLLLTYSLCFYLAMDLVDNQALVEKLMRAILLTALVICGVAMFEYWQWYYGDWLGEINRSEANLGWSLGASPRIKSVLYNPNILAYYLLPVLALSLYQLSVAHHRVSRLAWGGWILWVLVVIFLTQSRGGLLGACTVLVVFVGLWLVRVNWRSLPAQFRSPLLVSLGLAAMVGFVLLLLWPLIRRTFNASLFLGQRDDIWRIGLAIIQAFPWTGSGPATFGQQYLIFRQPGSDYLHSHAHNLWLTLGAELGLVGLAASLWLVLAGFQAVWRGLPQVKQPAHFTLMAMAIAGLSGMSVHNLLDDFLDYPMLTFHAMFLVALCLATINQEIKTAPGVPKMIPNVAATLLALAIGGSALWFQPAFAAYDLARAAEAQGQGTQAVQNLERAVEADPGYRLYRQQLALAYGRFARQEPSSLARALTLQTALLQENSPYPLNYANLACLYKQAGNLPAATQAMARAAALEPAQIYFPESIHPSRLTYQFSLVYLYEQAGQVEASQALLAQLLEAYPWVAASPFWLERRPQLQQMVSQLEAATDRTSPEQLRRLADLAYYAGNYSASLALAEQLLADTGEHVPMLIRQGQALAELKKFEAALAAFNRAEQLEPGNSAALLGRVSVWLQQNRLSQAEADLQVVMATGPTPEAYTLWGRLAEQQGTVELAIRRYEQAIGAATTVKTYYASIAGRRQPFSEEMLPCIIFPYTDQQLSQPALAAGRLLERAGQRAEAIQLYQLLLRHEPYNQAIQAHLARLN